MARSKPLNDPKEEQKRLAAAHARRVKRWGHDTPNGTSFRQLRRAMLAGYVRPVKVKHPAAYLNSSPAKSAYVARRDAERRAARDRSR